MCVCDVWGYVYLCLRMSGVCMHGSGDRDGMCV